MCQARQARHLPIDIPEGQKKQSLMAAKLRSFTKVQAVVNQISRIADNPISFE